jgi:hypothetical protein
MHTYPAVLDALSRDDAIRRCGSDGEGSTAHRGRFCGGSGRTRRRSGGSGSAGARRGMPTSAQTSTRLETRGRRRRGRT